jgi:outer membrane protein TolC
MSGEQHRIERKKRQFEAMVGLYQALGGGWRSGKSDPR